MTHPQQTVKYDQPEVPTWVVYERRKAQWREANPSATPEEFTAAIRRIIEELGL